MPSMKKHRWSNRKQGSIFQGYSKLTMRITHMSTFPLRASHAALALSRATVGWAASLRQAVELLLVWQERVRQRQQLRGLSDHMLRDIGLGRADVEAEYTKPFWQP
jgi:uncharacterized protein YjiS (DUF1127 family)